MKIKTIFIVTIISLLGYSAINAQTSANLNITVPVFGNQAFVACETINATSIIDPSANATFQAGQQIRLLPGFYAANGCDLHAYIHSCKSGTLSTTDQKTPSTETKRQVPEAGSLALSSSPNPFHSTTTFQYTLPQDSPVTLTIIDLTGRVVHQLVNEKQQKGVYEVLFDGQKLAAGMYLGQLKVGEAVKTIKLVLQ